MTGPAAAGAWRDLLWFEVAVYHHPPAWDDEAGHADPYPERAHFATAAEARREFDRLTALGLRSVHMRQVLVQVLHGGEGAG